MGLYNPGYFGSKFEIAVPEPASLSVLGVAALGLTVAGQRRQAGCTPA